MKKCANCGFKRNIMIKAEVEKPGIKATYRALCLDCFCRMFKINLLKGMDITDYTQAMLEVEK